MQKVLLNTKLLIHPYQDKSNRFHNQWRQNGIEFPPPSFLTISDADILTQWPFREAGKQNFSKCTMLTEVFMQR